MSVKDRANVCPQVLRQKREKLFRAFDILKENINFGIDNVSEERKNELIAWYRNACDLQPSAINDYPQELNKYL
ncbi:MAG: hypothetical protein J6T74_06080 [Clostridia bacterium]|nr:hypothetical protein [Clostridia bacterium]